MQAFSVIVMKALFNVINPFHHAAVCVFVRQKRRPQAIR